MGNCHYPNCFLWSIKKAASRKQPIVLCWSTLSSIPTEFSLDLKRTSHSKLWVRWLGTVATCRKPNSVAGVAWMDTSLERLGSTPSHEEWQSPQGDPTKQLLYQGAETKSWKNASLRSRFALNQKVERKVAVSIPMGDEVFSAILCFKISR